MSLLPRTPVAVRHAVLAVLVVLACVAALWNSYPWSGPVLFSVSRTHGLHATDPVFLTLAPLCVALLFRSARRCALLPSRAYALAA